MVKAQAQVRQVLNGKPAVNDEDINKLTYVQNVIKETLRLHVPVPLLPRLSHADSRVLGYDIPKGTKVLVNAWAMGRDSKYWDDADAFKPERYFFYFFTLSIILHTRTHTESLNSPKFQ